VVLLLGSRVCGGEDIDVLPALIKGLRKMSPMEPVDVMATMIDTHVVKTIVVREGLHHVGVQGFDVGLTDGPFPGAAKDGAELWLAPSARRG
jgi:hypothetical protein